MGDRENRHPECRDLSRLVILHAVVVLAIGSWAEPMRAGDSAAAGSIRGRVSYQVDSGRPWRLGRYYIADARSGNLRGAVVALRARNLRAENDSPVTVTIDQLNHQFTPETVAIQAGDTVLFTNSDATLHNVKTSGGDQSFSVNLNKGEEFRHTFQRGAGFRPVTLSCGFHGAMRGWIYVFDHPYFALTTTDGAFELKDVPPGRYRLEMVHPAGDLAWKQMIEVPSGQSVEVDINVSPDNKRQSGPAGR